MGIKYRFNSIIVLIFIALVILSFYTKRENRGVLDDQKTNRSNEEKNSSKRENRGVLDDQKTNRSNEEKNSLLSRCDLFSGKWVFDKSSKSIYSGLNCSFMDEGMACEKFGRKNLNYKYWRWQPHHCDLPRFDAMSMLEKLRNKRMVFVGDSLNRNQWVSMVCMVESLIPPASKYVHFNGSLVTFKATVYNATIDFYWAPLLVESNCDNPSIHRVPDRIVRIHAIEKHARNWIDTDLLVFNSYLWWRQPKFKILQGSFESPDGIYEDVEMLRGYEMALKTWSDWLDIHVNRTRTKLFFVSISPTHNRAEEWDKGGNKNCYNETEPILKEGHWGMDSDSRMMRLVEASIQELKTKEVNVQILNITQLSEYRKEGHSSIYRKYWDPLSKEQLSNPSSYADCTHWCLPGVPDVWNVLLYTYLLF